MDSRQVTEAVIEISNSIFIAREHNTNNLTPHARRYTREETDIEAARQLMAENGDNYVRLDKLEKALGQYIAADKLTYVAVDVQLKLLLQD
jgi:hypothetical protein